MNPNGTNGEFPTVQSAVDAVAGQSETDRANIFIAPAKYVELVTVDKPFITFIGQGATPAGVNISFNSTHAYNGGWEAATLINVGATQFMARNLTFENSSPDRNVSAAIALECDADRTIFDNVRFLGYQDTLLVGGSARQYFRGSFITGDTDFIFGNATAVFDRCTIESTYWGYITAANTSRTTANGLVFLDCELVRGTDRNPSDDGTTAPNDSVFLGRPWRWFDSDKMPSVIFIRTRMGSHITRPGWDPWEGTGPSSNRDPFTRLSEWGSMNSAGRLLPDFNQDGTPDGRVGWADSMTAEQAANYNVRNIFGPVEFWNATTQPETSGIPYASQGEPWNPHTQLLALPAQPGAKPQLLNVSTRLRVGAGQPVGIGGFIITGVAPKKVIVRAIGPSLQAFGVGDALADPFLEVHGGAQNDVIAANDNWQDDPAAASELASKDLTPGDGHESATVLTLSPGQYTAVISGKDGSAGTALVEVYDGDPAADSRLGNVSTLGFTGTGDNVLIGGFVVGGPASANVVVRALGPSLTSFGVQNAIENPTLEVHDGNGHVTSNDDWQTAGNSGSIPIGLQPSDPREAAISMILVPGSYTAIIRGSGETTGVALVEVYNVQ